MSENTQLKTIDLNAGRFMANGKEYIIESGLSITRYCEYQILEKELGFGMTFKGMFAKIKQATAHFNKLQLVDGCVILGDIMRGISKMSEKEPTVFKICALFMNTADENRAIWSNDLLNAKLNDWKAEGLDIAPFFTVAHSSVNGYLEIYNQVTRTISEVLDSKPSPDQSAEK